MSKNFNHSLRLFLRSFLQGLVIIGPIAATVGIIWYFISGVDNLIPSISEQFPGLVFVIVILTTAFVGFIGNKFIIGKVVVDSFDYVLEHTPGIKFIYTSFKDVMSSFVGDKKKFNVPVLVQTSENPEMWRVGFLTQSDLSSVGFPNYVSVYMPQSYAVSGWVVFVLASNIKILTNVDAANAMKFAVSGGVAGFHSDVAVFKAPE
ncbi:DUF502 domain-containing protein [Halpernia frigidisoli]|uniref:Uncharacterized membrane protein n=1 Tax=Halpernia frigidisoli TaxID=1125876 RepID=A0A1I3HM61_9FLAO|nr:DUF502 domain-containing protein [Halpernia frigidisoli]SFI36742.1 Uncharacterized membrane protein [Halpernia frigidisoli]